MPIKYFQLVRNAFSLGKVIFSFAVYALDVQFCFFAAKLFPVVFPDGITKHIEYFVFGAVELFPFNTEVERLSIFLVFPVPGGSSKE